MTAVIYGLYCPVAKTIRYVGKSNDAQNRFRSHLEDASGRGTSHRAKWIRQLLSKNLLPRLKVLFCVPAGGSWQKAERSLITKYRSAGCRLTNLTDGGDGWSNMAPSVRRRHKQSLRRAAKRRGSKVFSDLGKKSWAGIGAKEYRARCKDHSDKQKASWKRDRERRIQILHSPLVVAKREAIKASPEVNARWRAGLRAAWVIRKARQELRGH